MTRLLEALRLKARSDLTFFNGAGHASDVRGCHAVFPSFMFALTANPLRIKLACVSIAA